MTNESKNSLTDHAFIVCNFKSDLAEIVKDEFDSVGLQYDDKMELADLVARHLRIPDHSDHPFHSISITDSTGIRSVIPVDSDHPWPERAAVLENLM